MATRTETALDISTDDLTPELQDVLEYWRTIKTDRFAPTWPEFELLSLPMRLIPLTMVVDVADPVADSTFRFWGTRLSDIHGKDMTGAHPRDIQPPELGETILKDHQAFVHAKKPSARHYTFTTARGLSHSHSLLRLPLSDDGTNVTHIVIVIDYSKEALQLIEKIGADKYREQISAVG